MSNEHEVRIAADLRDRYEPENPSPEIYADELVIWHNYDEVEIKLTREQLGEGAKLEHSALGGVLSGFGYEDRRVYAGDGVVTMTHVMVGTLANGTGVRIPACSVNHVEDGRIRRSDVYMDFGQAKALAEAFMEAGVTLQPE
jgi:ketosteroid isomerase-like protein